MRIKDLFDRIVKEVRKIFVGQDELVEGTLQKGGVDRNHRFHSLTGQTGSEGNCMLFGDTYVIIAV